MQRREHSILADNRVTDFPCTSPRQFTQKFRYWRLHKNARRKAERKSRGAASIYRNGTGSVGGQQSPNSVTRMVTRGVTLTSPDNESSIVDMRILEYSSHGTLKKHFSQIRHPP